MKILLIFTLFCAASQAQFFSDLNSTQGELENSENSKQSVKIPTH